MLELYQDDLQDLLLLVPKGTQKVGCQCRVWLPGSERGAVLCRHLLQAVSKCKQRWAFLVLCQNTWQDLLQLVFKKTQKVLCLPCSVPHTFMARSSFARPVLTACLEYMFAAYRSSSHDWRSSGTSRAWSSCLVLLWWR